MKAYLFGAGASHSYSQSSTGVRPPLAKGFFEAYNQLEIAADRHVLIGDIVNYVRDTRGIQWFQFAEWNENVEDFLTEIEGKIGSKELALALSLEERFRVSRAYNEMLFLFCSILNEIQNGPPCPNYKKLVTTLEPDDVLITFNWDTLLDRTLFETNEWSPKDGYDLQFEGFFRGSWRTSLDSEIKSKWKLLKLHGSTNWIMPYRTLYLPTGERAYANSQIDDSTRPIFCFIKSVDTYQTYMNRSKSGYAPFSYYYYPPDIPIKMKPRSDGMRVVAFVSAFDLPEDGTVASGGFPYASMPLIVPPVRHKEYGLLGNALDQLWASAESSMSVASELIIIGYSFPPTDIRSWEMLINATRKRDHPLSITLVNPHPDQLFERLSETLGGLASIKVQAQTFDAFVDSIGAENSS